jgi:hypothetical protein
MNPSLKSWARDLGFVILCGAGLMAMAAWLLASRVQTARWQPALMANTGAWQSVIERLNHDFLQHWSTVGMVPAPRADEWTVIRRLGLGLTGAIPSLEEIRVLEALSPEQRIDSWLEHLLADRRYSDYLAERLARAYVGTEDGPFLVYRRRRFVTWLSDQLHQGRPYDQLVRELIADVGLWTDSPAVNFLTVTLDVNDDKQPDEQRLAARTSRAFLGVRLDCVQCHDDHLGGPWRQEQFQQLAACYAGARSSLLGIQDQPRTYEYQPAGSTENVTVAPAFPFDSQLAGQGQTARERLAHWVTHPENLAFGRAIVNRMWALLCGQPLVEPVDSIPLTGPYPPGLQTLAEDFLQNGCDLRRLIRVIAHSQPFQLQSSPQPQTGPGAPQSWAAFPRTRLRPEQVASSLLQASSLTTLDAHSHILVRLARSDQLREFVRRYGDRGEDEFGTQESTIPQRLLLMNGQLITEHTKDDLLVNAVTRIAALTPDDTRALDNAYLAVLTRHATTSERDYFLPQLAGRQGPSRRQVFEDLYWALLNSAEFAWNH